MRCPPPFRHVLPSEVVDPPARATKSLRPGARVAYRRPRSRNPTPLSPDRPALNRVGEHHGPDLR